MESETAISATPAPRPSRRALLFGLMLLVAGAAMAFFGQQILSRLSFGDPALGEQQTRAGALLILGAIAFGAGASLSDGGEQIRAAGVVDQEAPGDASRPTLSRFAIPVGFSIASIVLFDSGGETPLVVFMWLAGMIGVFGVALSSMKRRWHLPSVRIGWHVAALLALLVVYGLSRLVWLSTLPLNLDGDFASVGLEARALLDTQPLHIFGFGWAAIPLLGYMPSALSLAVFGDSLAGLNASGVAQGLLVVVGVYLLGRELFQPRFGVIASALLVVSLAFLSASRQCVYIDPLPFMLFSIYFLIIGYRRGLQWPMVLGGILGGFSLLMYYSGRLLIPIVAVLVLYLWIHAPRLFRDRLGLLGLWVLGLAVTLGPMWLLFARYTDATLSRTREVFILDPAVVAHLKGVYQVDSIPGVLLENARRSALLFNHYPDTSTQFGMRHPLLDVITGPLFVLGVGVAIFQLKKLGPFLILAWTAMGVIVGAFLTNNSPFWPRLIVIIPPTLMLAALALQVLQDRLSRILRGLGRLPSMIPSMLVALLVMAIGIMNWNTYVSAEASWADARSRIGRYLLARAPDAPAYLVSSGFNFRDREFDFLIPGRIVASIDPSQLDAIAQYMPRRSIVIITPEYAALVSDLQRTFPDGQVVVGSGNSPGEIAFYAFHAP